MPDYTDPYLIPFPTEEEFGDGSNGLEEMARAVDALHGGMVSRLTPLSTKPTLIRRQSADLAYAGTGFFSVTFNTEDHNNASMTAWFTPAVGAHPVAGVYPALWRFDLWIWLDATTETLGTEYFAEVEMWQLLPGESFTRQTRSWESHIIESATGGEYMSVSGAAVLDAPAEFRPKLTGAAGLIKAGSNMSLTRIRGI
jgi:hypothetical protein